MRMKDNRAALMTDASVLHLYRKRKFFYELAALLQEEPPQIQRLTERFPRAPQSQRDRADPTATAPSLSDQQPCGSTSELVKSSAEPLNTSAATSEGDSFEYVEFDGLQDALSYASGSRHGLTSQRRRYHPRQWGPASVREPTSCVDRAERLLRLRPAVRGNAVLDAPRDGAVPSACGRRRVPNAAVLPAGAGRIRRILQLPARGNVARARVQAGAVGVCRPEYLLRKKTLVGVSYEVWRIVGMYWDKYKQNCLHQHELYFADHHVEHKMSSKWTRMRDFLHVYGMNARQASKLADIDHSFAQSDDHLASKQLLELLKRAPHASPLHFGVKYLSQVVSFSKKTHQQPTQRHVISQPEWKIAFNAIVVHLQKWIPDVHVFPCGSFSRGAAYGSTIDTLVALPEELFASCENKLRSGYDDVAAALSSAKVVQEGSEHRVSATRGLFVVPYKTSVLILDLKVHEPPKSWFALLYFTGPQHFAHDFYCSLLQISLQELPEVTFDAIYAKTVAVLGLEKVASIECEKDIFDLAGHEYLLPSFRM